MGFRITDSKFVSAIALAGAVSLISVPACANDRQPGEQTQRQQTERQPGQQMQTESGQEMQQQLSSEQIREAQEKLQQEGHSPGAIDGQWSPQTQAAVKEFQREKNLQVTGELDQETLKELGVSADDPGMKDRTGQESQRDDQSTPQAQRQQDPTTGAAGQTEREAPAGSATEQHGQVTGQQQQEHDSAIGQRTPGETAQPHDQSRDSQATAQQREDSAPGQAMPGDTMQRQDQTLGQQHQQFGTETHQELTSDQIQQAQQKLQQEGYDPGPIDGQWSPQTQTALKEFQQAKNLPVTGQLDQQTMQELDIKAEAQPDIAEPLPSPPQGQPGEQKSQY